MSYHYHYLKPIASQTIEKVRKDIERRAKRRSVKYQIDDLREMSYTLPTNYSFTIYRIFISAIDSGELKDVGWVLNDRNTFCLLCFKDFGMSRWKHHCRACGILVCKECSNFENILVSFEELGPQKVCQSCYKPVGILLIRCFLLFYLYSFFIVIFYITPFILRCLSCSDRMVLRSYAVLVMKERPFFIQSHRKSLNKMPNKSSTIPKKMPSKNLSITTPLK